MSNRRKFLHQTLVGVAGAGLIPFSSSAAFQPAITGNTEELAIGIAGYTFAKFSIDQSIAMMKRLNITNLSLKDIHLPINSTDTDINNAVTKFKNAGINIYTVGVIYMKTKETVDTAFEYAKKVGVSMIVGVPSYDLIEYATEKVKQYDMKLAIHNHGPEDALYPAPSDVYNRIKDLDARVGMCIDIGHSLRAGTLPEKAIKDYKDRLFDIHIKDINAATKDGKAIEIGRGVIHINEVITALKKIQYKGYCSIEFEKDMSDPLAGIAESIGYFKGVMRSIK